MLWEFSKFLRHEAEKRSIPNLGVPPIPNIHVFFWIDYSCIDQGMDSFSPTDSFQTKRSNAFNVQFPYVNALSIYVSCCHVFLCNEGKDYDYDDRVWCTLERAVAFASCMNGTDAFVIREGFKYKKKSSYNNILHETRRLKNPGKVAIQLEKERLAQLSLEGKTETNTIDPLKTPVVQTATSLAQMIKGRNRFFLTIQSNNASLDPIRPFPILFFTIATILSVVGLFLPVFFFFLSAYDGSRRVKWGQIVKVRVLQNDTYPRPNSRKDTDWRRAALLLGAGFAVLGAYIAFFVSLL
eukprot:m.140487 g.140487  ORF g.140487 m.140487 type:complete len:296 (+) comp31076_c0_seq1:570-1457(+)